MSSQKSLFEFAKSIGAVETIRVTEMANSQQPHQSAPSASKYSTQTFRYLVVMDFEATCWPEQDMKWKTHEIIEFPAVLLNMVTGQVEAQFQQFVMPVENPRLSEFCTKLTGIRQDQVEGGVPLKTCLPLFGKWLKQVLGERGLVLPKTDPGNQSGSVAFATWSDWDFGKCLSKECTRKRIEKPACFDQWIDVRAIYMKFYQHRPLNFGEALDKRGLGFEGRPHSGLDDSKNLARLITRMCKDGANFVITKDLRPFEIINK
ncbi:3' histone mRNA exonuclease 1 [Culex quinquefasciatus]|uniref:3' histone mRNA exonuclease 1 n=1 Tax=Culex quinquefasciatus TaxID=7176 RepID=B0WX94_CULQU|nr:3' histone mRNA exonuclease 1 [Culex quinquefasciatus]|eukprot:XP_001862016.1 3' histone mRNA exonuclease 1 [Culex quinquefasciatus]